MKFDTETKLTVERPSIFVYIAVESPIYQYPTIYHYFMD